MPPPSLLLAPRLSQPKPPRTLPLPPPLHELPKLWLRQHHPSAARSLSYSAPRGGGRPAVPPIVRCADTTNPPPPPTTAHPCDATTSSSAAAQWQRPATSPSKARWPRGPPPPPPTCHNPAVCRSLPVISPPPFVFATPAVVPSLPTSSLQRQPRTATRAVFIVGARRGERKVYGERAGVGVVCSTSTPPTAPPSARDRRRVSGSRAPASPSPTTLASTSKASYQRVRDQCATVPLNSTQARRE